MKPITKQLYLLMLLLVPYLSSAQQWDWAKIFPTTDGNSVRVSGMAVLGSNYYLTGRFKGTISYIDIFGNNKPVTSLGNYPDAFVACLNSSGTIIWFTRAGTEEGWDQGNDIIAVAPGYIIVTGYVGEHDYTPSPGPDAEFISAVGSSVPPMKAYGNGNKKAFVARYSSAGQVVWVNGLHEYSNVNCLNPVLSEGMGIAETPGSNLKFYVTGYFESGVTIGAPIQNAAPPTCSSPFLAPTQCDERTFVMEFSINGCVNWLTMFEGDWNKGADIACSGPSSGGWGNNVYVVGDFSGGFMPLGPGSYVLTTAASGAQSGYIVRLDAANGTIKKTGTTLYHAQKIESQTGSSVDGYVTMRSVVVHGNNPPRPVAAGEWFGPYGNPAVLKANHYGSPTQSVANYDPTYNEVFLTRYAGDLLGCDWLNQIGGPRNDYLGIPALTSDGAGGKIDVNPSGNIFITGSFQGSCDLHSVGGSTKSISATAGSMDQDIFVAKYDINGTNIYAEEIMGKCNGNDDYGMAAAIEHNSVSYTDGGYFAGYSGASLGFNENEPIHEFVLNANSPDMSFYGRHQDDECIGTIVEENTSLPTLFTFYVDRTPGSGSADLWYNLPLGSYNIAYRIPAISKPHGCVTHPSVTAPNWNHRPLTVTAGGVPTFTTISGLDPSQTYEWFIQTKCGGRWATIDPMTGQALAKWGMTSIDEVKNADEISVYPNPAKNEVSIEFADKVEKDATIEIRDMTGKLVKSQNAHFTPGSNVTIDIQDSPAGLYVVKVFSSTDTVPFVTKVVKE